MPAAHQAHTLPPVLLLLLLPALLQQLAQT
jgi:hypothetical protein